MPRYADPQTGKGKANPRAIGRAIANLGLRADNIRVKDEGEQRLRAWRLDKAALVRIRQSLYLDDLGTLGTFGTSPSAPPTLDTHIHHTEEETEHTQSNVPNVPKETT